MHVDRARFLLLTASIATGSCTPPSGARAPASDGDVEVAPPSIAIDPAADEPLPNQAPTEPAVDQGEPIDHDARLATRLAETCQTLKPPPGPHCESFHSTVEECEIFGRVLRPEAAERAVECLVAKSGHHDICTYEAAGQCFIVGSLAVHPEPDTTKPCTRVLSNCGSGGMHPSQDLNAMTCRTALSAVKSDRREILVSCMNESCTIGGCLYDLDSS